MANLSNINNKLLVGTNGEVRIGDTATIANVKLRVVQTANQWVQQIVSTGGGYGLSIDTTLSTHAGAGSLQIYTNAGTGFIVQNSGFVGIGTHSPIHPLYVDGDIGQTDGSRIWFRGSSSSSGTGAQSYVFSDGLNLKIKGDDNVQLLGDGGGVIAHFDYTGDVGIGTITPDALLELSKSVANAQGATLRLTNAVGGAGAGVAVEFVGPGTQPIHAKIITEDAGAYDSDLIFQTKVTGTGGALVDRLIIDENGDVGINTTPRTSANKKLLSIDSAWGGQLDIGVNGTSHAQFGTDNYSSGAKCRIQSASSIAFKVNGGTLVETIDAAGSIAIGGFIPSGTPTGDYRSLEIGRQGNTITGSPFKSALYLSTNATITAGSTQFTYRYASVPAIFQGMESNGDLTFSNATSGSAGGNISFTPRMRIFLDGDITMGQFVTTQAPANGILKIRTSGSTANVCYPLLYIGGSTHLATRQYGIGFDPEGYTDRMKMFFGADGMGNGYSYGDFVWNINTVANNDAVTPADEKMRLNKLGYLGIGITPTYGYKLDVFDATEALFRIRTSNATGNGGVYIGNGDRNWAMLVRHSQAESFEIRDETANETRMRISSSGRVTINTTIVADAMCTIAGNSSNYALNLYADSIYSGIYRYQRFRSGTSIAGGIEGSNQTSVQYVTTSDYRTKKNIKPLENGLDRVCKLKPVKFDWKLNNETTEGFIAHEVQDIFPEAVTGEKDGKEMQGMDYGRITPLLVAAIQELKAEIELLKSK